MRSSIDELQPIHLAVGLGGASRDFLAVCLGVFDDAKLLEHLKGLIGKALSKVRRADPTIGESVERGAKRWLEGDLSDHQLRVLLWIRLRRAWGLDPGVTRSTRGCERLADELVAAAMHWRDDSASPGAVKRVYQKVGRGVSKAWRAARGADGQNDEQIEARRNTLGDLVEPLILQMVQRALGRDADAMSEEDKKRLGSEIVAGLEEDQRQALLRVAGESDAESALVKLAVAGGAHGSFALAVGATGFAPYILAAKASAFIPMVSGPALVSLVSVVANPVVVVLAVVGFGAHLTRKANERAVAQVALTLIALLVCDGMSRRRDSLESLMASFATIPELPDEAFVDRKEASAYREAWSRLQANSWLAAPGPPPPLAAEWERRNMRRDTVAIGAASIGDIVYSLAAIDPQVVAAADYSSRDSIDDPVDFAAHLLGKVQESWLDRKGVDRVALEGDIASLKGFTMENLVATKLAEDGHAVELPDDPNQPGWDLIVDGERFQVKCLADSGGLKEHFEKYPEIPVLANSDLIDDRKNWPEAWQENVFFVEGHRNDVVEEVVRQSYGEGTDLADSDVPEIALAYVAARETWKLRKGEVTAGQAMSHLLMEGSARAGLAMVGGLAGSSVGFLLLGPAGALIIGNVLPVVAQGAAPTLVARLRARIGPKADGELSARCDALCDTLAAAMESKLAVLRTKYRQVGDGPAGMYVRYRLLDRARHLDEYQDRLLELREDTNVADRTVEILRVASQSVHPRCYQSALRKLQAN